MKLWTRIVAALVTLLALGGLAAGPAAAGPPVRVEGCDLIVNAPGRETRVPICWHGPPIR